MIKLHWKKCLFFLLFRTVDPFLSSSDDGVDQVKKGIIPNRTRAEEIAAKKMSEAKGSLGSGGGGTGTGVESGAGGGGGGSKSFFRRRREKSRARSKSLGKVRSRN